MTTTDIVDPRWTRFDLAAGQLALALSELATALTNNEAGNDGYRTIGNATWITRAGMKRLEARYLWQEPDPAVIHKDTHPTRADDKPSPSPAIDRLALIDAAVAAHLVHRAALDEAQARRQQLAHVIVGALNAGSTQRDVAVALGISTDSVRSLAALTRSSGRSQEAYERDLQLWLRPGLVDKIIHARKDRTAGKKQTPPNGGD